MQAIITGGRLNHSLDSLVGDFAATAVQAPILHPNIVFFGASGSTFEERMHVTYHFEEEISAQVAFATRPTVNRILLCDHTKIGSKSFYDANLSIESLMEKATNCYVITTYDPSNASAIAMLDKEQRALTEELSALHGREDFIEKDFIFRMIRVDGAVEREVHLDELRRRRRANPIEKLPSVRS